MELMRMCKWKRWKGEDEDMNVDKEVVEEEEEGGGSPLE